MELKRFGEYFGVRRPSSFLQPSSVAVSVGIAGPRTKEGYRLSRTKGRVLGEEEDGGEKEKGVDRKMLAMSVCRQVGRRGKLL